MTATSWRILMQETSIKIKDYKLGIKFHLDIGVLKNIKKKCFQYFIQTKNITEAQKCYYYYYY